MPPQWLGVDHYKFRNCYIQFPGEFSVTEEMVIQGFE